MDDARSHLSLIKMLRQFHYIDQNGKDQGINVRNRSQELGKLLSDVEAIRAERKKARTNKNKYGGVEGGAGLGGGFSSASSARYGGFGSEQGGFGGGYGGEVYGDGGGFGGQDPELRYQGTQRHGDDFEEYDAGADEASAAAKRTTAGATTSTSRPKRQSQPPAAKRKEPAKDLFSFDDEPAPSALPTNGSSTAPATSVMDDFGTLQSSTAGGDDDFDDFQSATSPAPAQPSTNPLAALSSPPPAFSGPSSATTFAAPQPVAPHSASGILSAPSPAPSATSSKATPAQMTSPMAQQKPVQPAGGFKPAAGPNYFTSVRADINIPTQPGSTPSFASRTPTATPGTTASYGSSTSMATLGKPSGTSQAAKPAGGDAFGSIWSTASTKAGVQQRAAPQKGPGLAAMQKEKSSAGIWGAAASSSPVSSRAGAQNPPLSAQPSPAAGQKPLGNGLDDLLG